MRLEPATSETVVALLECQCTLLAFAIKVGWARLIVTPHIELSREYKWQHQLLVYRAGRAAGPLVTWFFRRFTALYQLQALCIARFDLLR
jgi:hypothetical protein